MNNKIDFNLYRKVAIHLVFWLLWIHIFFDLNGIIVSLFQMVIGGSDWFDDAFIIIPFVIVLFYTNSEFLVPKYLVQSNWKKYLAGILIYLIVLAFIANGIFFLLLNIGHYLPVDVEEFNEILLIASLTTVGVSSALAISTSNNNNVRLRKAAEEERKIAEIKYLSNQVSPHFLFNALNALNSLSIQENAPKTNESILMLSEILRYPLSEGLNYKTDLIKEIVFVQSFVDWQRIRLGENYPIMFLLDGDATDQKIAPLVLIPIVENAFKYGYSPRNKSIIEVLISIRGNYIELKTKNEISRVKESSSHKIGLTNLKKRLNLIYGDQYGLRTEEIDGVFKVVLSIDLL